MRATDAVVKRQYKEGGPCDDPGIEQLEPQAECPKLTTNQKLGFIYKKSYLRERARRTEKNGFRFR